MTQTQDFQPGTLDAQDVLRLALTSRVYGAAVQTPLSAAPE
jgi:threonine dehydratase